MKVTELTNLEQSKRRQLNATIDIPFLISTSNLNRNEKQERNDVALSILACFVQPVDHCCVAAFYWDIIDPEGLPWI